MSFLREIKSIDQSGAEPSAFKPLNREQLQVEIEKLRDAELEDSGDRAWLDRVLADGLPGSDVAKFNEFYELRYEKPNAVETAIWSAFTHYL
ncbi:hypothetical protein ACQ4M3_23470 [Leptolyngbya sp. AN03gr2]|uniref:hypothetical protein n=1 Tax=unclassified Leptolyngbya TaxID=2650499 RepID=UPI003D31DEAE